ncbi:nucleotidyltransferase family protein [Vibrio sinaloensis]|nr:nucleotidyltransferase family protein [Vibrio sinaloensis]
MRVNQVTVYEKQLLQLIESVPELIETARVAAVLGISNYYLAGGAITQVIWNHIDGQPLLSRVKDFDLVYFDQTQAVEQSEYEQQLVERVSHNIPVDVKNQATIHQVYAKKLGFKITPYTRVEQGIDSWLSAFAIGFRLDEFNRVRLYAPYGLEDAFYMRIKPNKLAMSKRSYQSMTESYRARWPNVQVMEWD